MSKRNNISRRTFIKSTAAAGSLLAMGMGKGGVPVKSRQNVLFIAVDDLRPQLGCYGHTKMHSPNMDALAGEGMLFEKAYCQVPVCGASRASLMTGLRPTRDRFADYWSRADKEAPGSLSLARHFKNNGYQTISNGKIYHHAEDQADAWSEAPWTSDDAEINAVGNGYLNPANVKEFRETKKGPAYECAEVGDSDYFDGALADKTIADLKRMAHSGQPFFLATGFKKPHLPFNAPRKYWNMYKDEDIDLADNPFAPKNAPLDAMHNWGELRGQYNHIPKQGPLADEDARKLIHGYYACVSYVDAQVGRVLDTLKETGLSENTIVILWGDHGWNLGEHGLWCKHSNFENCLHSPLVINAPGFTGGQKTSALVEFVDIFPSLCELTGVALPPGLQGTSFKPLLSNPDRKWKNAAYSRWKRGESVKTERYRYTRYQTRRGYSWAHMLYDHQVDPEENTNIADLKENAELVAKLSGMLKEGWRGSLP